MSTRTILFRREALSQIRSTYSWALMSTFAAATGFYMLMSLHTAEGTIETLQTLYARALILSLPILCALATMKVFSGERMTGTIETLLTAPVSDAEVVMAKFWSALLLVVFSLAASLVGFVIYVETALPAPVYSRTGIAAALALTLLHAAAWTALGILSAVLTRHQAAAAAGCLLPAALHSSIAAGILPGTTPSGYVNALSIVHVARGVLDTRPILLCLSLTFFFVFLATRCLEARRWKV